LWRYRGDVSIQCGHCDGEHETIDEARVCADSHYYTDGEPLEPPKHCERDMFVTGSRFATVSMSEGQDGCIPIQGPTCPPFLGGPFWVCNECGLRIAIPRPRAENAAELGRSDFTAPSRWTKVRMRLQYWITGDV
jgi:hypothetical protein